MYDILWCLDLLKLTYSNPEIILLKQVGFEIKENIGNVKIADVKMQDKFNMSFEDLGVILTSKNFSSIILPMNSCNFAEYKRWFEFLGAMDKNMSIIIIDLAGRIFVYPDLNNFIYAGDC